MYFKPIYKIHDWVNEEKLYKEQLSKNPNSIDYLKKNMDLIIWKDISRNENAIDILESNLDKIDWNTIYSNKNAIHLIKKHILIKKGVLITEQWNNLCQNDNCMLIFNDPNIKHNMKYGKNYFLLSKNHFAIPLLEENLKKIEWGYLSFNPGAMNLLQNNLSKIVWSQLCKNPNLEAIQLLRKNMIQINWWSLNNNPNGHLILRNYPDKIIWSLFCSHSNDLTLCYENLDKVDWFYFSARPEAIHVLEKNLDKINWKSITWNKNAGHIIRNNLDKIEDHWYYLSKNPCIFSLDYEQMKNNNMTFAEELIAYVYHPKRVLYYMNHFSYNLLEDSYNLSIFYDI